MFSSLEGVTSVTPGYIGADDATGRQRATYSSVCGGDGNAEALRVEFDDDVITYEALLEAFFNAHDAGRRSTAQYRSAIWPNTEAQRVTAMRVIEKLENERRMPVMTTIENPNSTTFWRAEWYHRNYKAKNNARLAAAAAIFCLNNFAPDAPFRVEISQFLTLAVIVSIIPQVVPQFDRIFDALDE